MSEISRRIVPCTACQNVGDLRADCETCGGAGQLDEVLERRAKPKPKGGIGMKELIAATRGDLAAVDRAHVKMAERILPPETRAAKKAVKRETVKKDTAEKPKGSRR